MNGRRCRSRWGSPNQLAYVPVVCRSLENALFLDPLAGELSLHLFGRRQSFGAAAEAQKPLQVKGTICARGHNGNCANQAPTTLSNNMFALFYFSRRTSSAEVLFNVLAPNAFPLCHYRHNYSI